VRRPSLSEIFVAKSLLSWVWKTIVDRKEASSSAYLTLMPPEGSTNFNVRLHDNDTKAHASVCELTHPSGRRIQRLRVPPMRSAKRLLSGTYWSW
jgi:hypothetical protein